MGMPKNLNNIELRKVLSDQLSEEFVCGLESILYGKESKDGRIMSRNVHYKDIERTRIDQELREFRTPFLLRSIERYANKYFNTSRRQINSIETLGITRADREQKSYSINDYFSEDLLQAENKFLFVASVFFSLPTELKELEEILQYKLLISSKVLSSRLEQFRMQQDTENLVPSDQTQNCFNALSFYYLRNIIGSSRLSFSKGMGKKSSTALYYLEMNFSYLIGTYFQDLKFNQNRRYVKPGSFAWYNLLNVLFADASQFEGRLEKLIFIMSNSGGSHLINLAWGYLKEPEFKKEYGEDKNLERVISECEATSLYQKINVKGDNAQFSTRAAMIYWLKHFYLQEAPNEDHHLNNMRYSKKHFIVDDFDIHYGEGQTKEVVVEESFLKDIEELLPKVEDLEEGNEIVYPNTISISLIALNKQIREKKLFYLKSKNDELSPDIKKNDFMIIEKVKDLKEEDLEKQYYGKTFILERPDGELEPRRIFPSIDPSKPRGTFIISNANQDIDILFRDIKIIGFVVSILKSSE